MVKLMKKISTYLTVFSLFICMQINAQFTITAIPPPSGNSFTFDQLWNFTATRPLLSNYVEFYVSLRIYDNQGNLLVKSNSSVFPFSQPALTVNPMNMGPLNPLSTLYYDNTLQSVIQNGGFFPPGTYNI